jgi:hypothetical protein
MRSLRYLTAATALGGMLVLPQTGWTSPLLTSLPAVGSTAPVIADGPVLKVHGWHCAKKKGWYKGDKVWHRHRRACYESQYDDDDFYDDDYVYRRRTSPGVYINPGASIRLHLGGQGDWD